MRRITYSYLEPPTRQGSVSLGLWEAGKVRGDRCGVEVVQYRLFDGGEARCRPYGARGFQYAARCRPCDESEALRRPFDESEIRYHPCGVTGAQCRLYGGCA